MMKVLLDTNVWISGLLWGGNPRKIIQLAEEELITLYTSLPLFQELEETLNYPKLQLRLQKLGMTASYVLSAVRRINQFCQPLPLPPITELRDSKDKVVLETALAIPVEVIVSGDEDLLVLGEFQRIIILTASDFLMRYGVNFDGDNV
ncbi:MAG: putative toxin-antitoxin system toxin component, PIN family [Gloeotrichia echinulata GP01]